MRPAVEVLKYIASDNSKLFKEFAITSAAAEGNQEFFDGIYLALDNFQTFGVKKIPELNIQERGGSGLPMRDFAKLCDELQTRVLTGNAAQDAIAFAMQQSTHDEWNNWYRLILMKDLKAGFSETTVNKAVKDYPQFAIPVFSCQLAHDAKDADERLVGKKYIDVKLDGARVLTFIEAGGKVFQTSRNGKLIENFGTIRTQFETVAKKYTGEPLVIDGEMMSSSFQDLMTQFKRKTNVQTNDAMYYVFDIIPLAEFKKGKSKHIQSRRIEQLTEFMSKYESDTINTQQVGTECVDLDTKEGKQRFKEINEKAVENKYEGVMLKNPDGFYTCKRTWDWMKKKPVISVSLEVVGVQEGKPESKYVGMLGALECKGTDNDDPRVIEVNVGGGFSDDQRKNIWDNRDSALGMFAEIEADAITKNQNGTYSLRFPRFKNFRGFKAGEKI